MRSERELVLELQLNQERQRLLDAQIRLLKHEEHSIAQELQRVKSSQNDLDKEEIPS